MPTIPLGNGGRLTPGRAPQVSVPQIGGATARALEQAGAEGVQFGLQLQAQEAHARAMAQREADAALAEETRKQEAAAEAAARAKDSAALLDAEDRLRDAHDEIATGVLGGSVPKDQAEKAWSERAKQITDELLPNLREQARPLAQPHLTRLTNTLGNGIRKAREKRDRQDVTTSIDGILETAQRTYTRDPASAQALVDNALRELGPQSLYSPEQLARKGQAWKEGAQYNVARAAVNAGRNDGKALTAAEKLIRQLPDLDEGRRVELLDRVQNYRIQHANAAEIAQRRALAAQEHRLKVAEAEFNSGMKLAQEGTLNSEFAEAKIARMAGTPYAAAFRQAFEQQRKAGPLAAQPTQDLRTALDQVNATIARSGITETLKEQRDTLQRVMAAQERDIKEDGGLRAWSKRGLFEAPAPLDLTGGLPDVAKQLAARLPLAALASRHSGRQESPLYPEEAAALGDRLQQVAPADRATFIAALSKVATPRAVQAIASQIDGKNRALALEMAAGASQTKDGRFVAELIGRGAQAIKDKTIKEDTSAEAGLRKMLADEVGDALPGKARDDVIDAARLIYLGQQAGGIQPTPRGALRVAIGGDLLEVNGRKVPVPAGMDEAAMKQRLAAYPAAALKAQAPDDVVYLPGGRPLGAPEFLARLPDAQLEPAGLGRYMVRTAGGLVMNAQRRPIVIEVGP